MGELATRRGAPAKGAASALKGEHKAVLLLLSLDDGVAAPILAQLGEDEIRKLREAADQLDEVSPQQLAEVHREFAELATAGAPASIKGGASHLRRLTGRALGEGKAARIWNDRQVEGPFADLGNLDARTILAMLDDEHPQAIAVVLSQIDPARACDVVALLPTDRQTDVVRRIARLKTVPEATLGEIERLVAQEIRAIGDTTTRPVDGLKVAAGIVKRLAAEVSEALVSEIASEDQAAADEIRNALFTFEDLLLLDTRGMQALLKEIPTEQILPALKTASEDMRAKIFGSISARAAALLQDDLEMLGPVRLADVEGAQRAIIDTALRLEKEGVLRIAREGSGDYV